MDAGHCTIYDSSTPLLSQHFYSNAATFPQTGSWSWVNAIDSTLQGAISALSRYSAAGVDQYTVIVGQLLCTKFRLSQRSMDRVKHTIMKLRSMGSVGKMLHFGFGVDGVVRNLAATVEGATLVALCGAAMEAFAEDHAANVLWELVRLFDPPENRTPSPMQWSALLNACAGTLSTSDFPVLAEHLMHLDTAVNYIGDIHRFHGWNKSSRGLSTPHSMAQALLELGKVSTGELECVTIVGGADAGWLAALAEWLFDLRVTVWDTNNECVHSISTDKDPQVIIRYVTPADSDEQQTSAVSSLVVDSKIVYLKDISDVIFEADYRPAAILTCSRVPWNKALSLTFGHEVDQLLGYSRLVGDALAAAGQIFQELALSKSVYRKEIMRSCKSYFSDSMGRGFGRFATLLFPELEPLSEFIQAGMDRPDPLTRYDTHVANLSKGCGCKRCCGESRAGRDERGRFCLVLLLHTIIIIIRCMSGVAYPQDLCPMRSGLQEHYLRRERINSLHRDSKYGAAVNILLPDDFTNVEESFAIPRLFLALLIFTGRDFTSRDKQGNVHDVAALSRGGLVAFLSCLINDGISLDGELIGQCTIIPGSIEVHGRQYNTLEDFSDFVSSAPHMHIWLRLTPSRLDHLDSPEQLRDEYHTVQLVAQEGMKTAKVGMAIGKLSEQSKTVIIGPAASTARALQAMHVVDCDGSSCGSEYESIERRRDKGCIDLSTALDAQKVWYFTGNILSQMIALNWAVTRKAPEFYAIIKSGQCLDCCVKAAVASNHEFVLILNARTRD